MASFLFMFLTYFTYGEITESETRRLVEIKYFPEMTNPVVNKFPVLVHM